MKTKIKYGWLLCLLVFSACNSWIDITPSDRLNEDMLFEDRQGFEKAINGYMWDWSIVHFMAGI